MGVREHKVEAIGETHYNDIKNSMPKWSRLSESKGNVKLR